VSPSSAAQDVRAPRTVAILVAAFFGFLVGQILAAVLDMVMVQLTHYPGGFNHLAQTSSPPWWANVTGLVGLWIGFGGAIYFAYAYGNLKSLPNQWRPRVGDLAYVVLGVACQFAVDLAYRPFNVKSLNKPVKHIFDSSHGPTFVLLIIMTVFLAPVIEEWLFRGVILRSIAENGHFSSPRVASVVGVVTSAVLFALAHGEPAQFAGLAFLGVVLAVLVLRTRRLVPSIITHMSFNAVAIVALIAQRASH
jgi:membrane protease YdiL (CAAX protease family)